MRMERRELTHPGDGYDHRRETQARVPPGGHDSDADTSEGREPVADGPAQPERDYENLIECV
jgi:hypothetical protein